MPNPRIRLFVPTYNRPHSVLRLLTFLSSQNFKYPIALLDSSDREKAEENLATLKAFPGLEIKQLTFPSDTFFYEKLYQGISRFEQDFVAMCADDDIIVPESIDLLAQQLEQTPEAGFSHGITTRFWEKAGQQAYLDLEYRPIPYMEDCTLGRLQKLYALIESTIWSIYRPNILLNALNVARKTNAYFFGEMYTMTYTLAQAKATSLPIPLIHRSCEPFAETPSNWHPVFWLLRDRNEFRQHLSEFQKTLGDYLEPRTPEQTTRDKIDAFLDICFIDFFAPQWGFAKGKIVETLDQLRGIPPLPQVEQLRLYHASRRSTLTTFLNRLERMLRKIAFPETLNPEGENDEIRTEGYSFTVNRKLLGHISRKNMRAVCSQLAQYLKTAN